MAATAPIPVPGPAQKAGFWIRVGAYLVDFVLLIIVNQVLGFLFHSQGLRSLLGLILSIGYFVYLWSASGGGQTLGMRALRLQVVRTDGSMLDYGGAVLRYIGLFISFVVVCLGVIWVAFDPNKQGWHDKIAGTYVLRA